MTAAAYDLLWVTLPILVLALVASLPRNEPPIFESEGRWDLARSRLPIISSPHLPTNAQLLVGKTAKFPTD